MGELDSKILSTFSSELPNSASLSLFLIVADVICCRSYNAWKLNIF